MSVEMRANRRYCQPLEDGTCISYEWNAANKNQINIVRLSKPRIVQLECADGITRSGSQRTGTLLAAVRINDTVAIWAKGCEWVAKVQGIEFCDQAPRILVKWVVDGKDDCVSIQTVNRVIK